MFVVDPGLRQRFVNEVSLALGGPALVAHFDQPLREELVLSLLEANLLEVEFALANTGEGLSPEIVSAREALADAALDPEDEVTAAALQNVRRHLDALASLYRKKLAEAPSVTPSPEESRALLEHAPEPLVRHGYPEYGLGEDVAVYWVQRGPFVFLMIDEGGQWKVLALDIDRLPARGSPPGDL